MKQITFELGAIAYHCQEVYLSAPNKYDDYIPIAMLGASNDFYNFVLDSYHIFKKEDGTSLNAAWEMYKTYCDEAKVSFPHPKRIFTEELKNYFREVKSRHTLDNDSRVRSYYNGFRADKFEEQKGDEPEEVKNESWLDFSSTKSIFDQEFGDCPAQYASSEEKPIEKWIDVRTKLSDLNTSRVHYVRVPENHIVIDLDIPGEDGKKDLERNIAEASKFPPTYAELSKSGSAIHLHYYFSGDASRLSRVYDDHVEIKVPVGNSSLRRKLTKCNNLPIATISSGLPMKGEKMVNFDVIKSEKGLRTQIKRNLNKEIHAATKPSIDFIYKILEDAYNSDLNYDVTDMRNAVLAFAASSTNQAEYCIKLVNKMQFKSADASISYKNDDAKLVFYDVEVFPNLFLVNWKIEGTDKPVVRMINPTPAEIEDLMRFRLVGFNCRRYDNHILYARLMGYSEEQLYNLSMKIVGGERNCFFGEAYNVSYTDVYDFASAGNKKSLKKFEIELGIHHQELGLPWDQPVPKELWTKVAEYCDNDVIATEAVFNHLSGDWLARQILADLAGMTVNDTTNTLTTRIVFGSNRKPQDRFNYRNMGEMSETDARFTITEGGTLYSDFGDEYTIFDEKLRPVFPGYKYENGKSTYRGEEVGEGGYVYAEPGMYGNIAVLDVASMHPHSIIAEELFGKEYTRRFKEIVDGRVTIKHEDWDSVRTMLDGKLAKYIQKVLDGELSSKQLADALKTAINSVYGLTSASFDNAFHDPRNKDNIVAKRGALFMINLKHEVQRRGFIVAHIKTDSIKIPDASLEIIQFVSDYGKQYGYTFEHESTYDRMCLVNDAVYIAQYASPGKCQELYGYIPDDCKKKGGKWSATGTQFAVPYVFKTLFSKEDVVFSDMCEAKSVTSALYLDMNEDLPEGDHAYHFIGKVGNFCPIRDRLGGGLLLRETLNKKTNEKGYAAATGSKGYRWLEAEMVQELGKEDTIARAYYDKMVDDAVKTISSYGDFEWFVSGDPISGTIPTDRGLRFIADHPPWVPPCGDELRKSCSECPDFHNDQFHLDCTKGFDVSNVILDELKGE
jgi:hypothetical protein